MAFITNLCVNRPLKTLSRAAFALLPIPYVEKTIMFAMYAISL